MNATMPPLAGMPLRARHSMNRQKLIAEFPYTASSDNNLTSDTPSPNAWEHTCSLALGRCCGIIADLCLSCPPMKSKWGACSSYHQMIQIQWKDSHLQVKC